MTILSGYIGRLLLIRFLALSIGLVLFALAFDLLENADAVVASTGVNSPLLNYALYRSATLASRLLPVAALLAAILSFVTIIRHSELVALWNSGLSPFRQFGILLPAAAVLAIVQYGVDNQLMPPAADALRKWGIAEFQPAPLPTDDKGRLWVRSGNDIVSLRYDPKQPGLITDLHIFRRDESGKLILEVESTIARKTFAGWQLKDAIVRPVGEVGEMTRGSTYAWQADIQLQDIELLRQPAPELPLEALQRISSADCFRVRPGYIFETWRQFRFVQILNPILLVLLVAAVAQRFRRRGTAVWLIVNSVLVGFFYQILSAAAVSLGEAGLLPAMAAAWIPPSALTCGILAYAIRLE